MCTHPGFGSHFTRQNDILFSCWINILSIGLKEKIALKGADSFPKEFP